MGKHLTLDKSVFGLRVALGLIFLWFGLLKVFGFNPVSPPEKEVAGMSLFKISAIPSPTPSEPETLQSRGITPYQGRTLNPLSSFLDLLQQINSFRS